MRKVLAVLIIAGILVLALTMPALAARPAMVIGSAGSYSEYQGSRITTIAAWALPRGGATGLVRVDRTGDAAGWVTAVHVRDLAVEGDYAYLMGVVTRDTRRPELVGSWAYLVVYDGSTVGGVDVVSHFWILGEAEIRVLFEAHSLLEELGAIFWMPVTSGGYRLLP